MNDALLEVNQLIAEFRSDDEVVTAVNGISFTVKKGETVGIVGESGSGKSVTALSIMQLLNMSHNARVNGEIIFHKSPKESIELISAPEATVRNLRGNDMAMIFQEPMTSLNPVFTCGEQVSEALRLHMGLSHSEAKARTIELFKAVELPRPETLFDTYPHQISGGQKQRVMIAMAMSCEPLLLIADEPTTALDVTVQKKILKLMASLQAKYDMGLIFITHDLGVIAELADRVLVMYKGKIVEQGPVWDIFSAPQHPYTKGLLACRPPLDKRYYFLPTVSDFIKSEQLDGMEIESIDSVTSELLYTDEARKKRQEMIYENPPILEVKNLSKHFPIKKGLFGKTTEQIKAVDNASFEVFPGETLGLVGESGCGKTTLGRTIIRLIEPTSGSVIFKGKDISQLSRSALRQMRKNIQIIFQDPYSSLNPRMTIGNAIMEPMLIHKIGKNDSERKARVLELLERVNMKPQHFYRYPHEFSGGQRQRICIARALALNPEFIICDESVSALDVSVQAQVLNLLNELKFEFKFTFIFISHDLSVVKFMSDRMIVMKEGKIEELDDADRIYSNPKSEYTKGLIQAIPQGRLEDIKAAIKEREEARKEKGLVS